MKANAELNEFNKTKRDQLATSVAAERQADAQRLAAQLAKEAHENEREASARETMQAETRKFAEHMIAQKRALEQQQGVQEVARKAELDKAWDKRLAVWSKEQEAREALMAQVLNERKGQVEVKLQNVIIDKKNQAEARRRLEAELTAVNRMEADKLEEAKAVRMMHRGLLENQARSPHFHGSMSRPLRRAPFIDFCVLRASHPPHPPHARFAPLPRAPSADQRQGVQARGGRI